MAWPPDVADGNVILAAHINAIRNSVATWGGHVSAAGFGLSSLLNLGIGIAAPVRPFHVVQPDFTEIVIESTNVTNTVAAGRSWGITNAGGSLGIRCLNAAGSLGSAAHLAISPAGLVSTGGYQWNAGHLMIGPYHLWVDGSGKLRIKSTAPASDTDGVTVGSQ